MILEEVIESLILHNDKNISIFLIKRIESQHHTKYINIKYHYVRELVDEIELIVK